jgi:hypothetical protein
MASIVPGGGESLGQVQPGYTTLPGGQVVPNSAAGSDTSSSGLSTGAGSFAGQLGSLTAQSNLSALPYDEQLSQVINATDQAAQQTANMGRIPNEPALETSSSSDIAAELAGQLAPGTVSTIQDSMAQMYGGSGFGVDSAATSAAAMRAMGLTAEGQVQAGESNLTAAAGRNPAAPITSLDSLMVSPNQYMSAAQMAQNAQNTGTTSGGSGGTRASGGGGGSPYSTPANPFNPIANAGGGGGSTSSPVSSQSNFTPDTYSNYNPGGSSVFGTIDTGGGNTVDMFDPSGLNAAGITPTYGSMPDYSNPNASAQNPISTPSMLNNFGTGATSTFTPANTVYNSGTDTYNNNYGVPDYYSTYNPPSYYDTTPVDNSYLDPLYTEEWGYTG